MPSELHEMDWDTARHVVALTRDAHTKGIAELTERAKVTEEEIAELDKRVSGLVIRATLIALGAGIVGSYVLPKLADAVFPKLASMIVRSPLYVVMMGV